MEITAANLDALFKTFQTRFNDAQAAAQGRAYPNDLLPEDIAIAFTGSGSATQHSWLNQLKGIHEWVGQRAINALNLGKLTVVNRDFENTVTVSRNEIEDDQYGVYAPLIAMMGADAEGLWKKLAMEALLGNGEWADGNAFFCSGRVMGASTITNAVTTALGKQALETAIAAMRGWTLHGGEPGEVRPDVLLVGPSLEAAAKQLCEAELVADGGTTVSNVSPAKALKVRVSQKLVGEHANEWYVLGDKNGVKAVGLQKRKLPELTRLDSPTDPEVFMSNNFLYGVHARGEGFLTLPFLAYKGGAAEVGAWAEK
ncbi:MAG: Mu-like prophage major head subunit gpT family protein [Kiritimatiellia bacterium]